MEVESSIPGQMGKLLDGKGWNGWGDSLKERVGVGAGVGDEPRIWLPR